MPELPISADAPPRLVTITRAVRQVFLDHDETVAGSCIEGALTVGVMLLREGCPAEARSCSAGGDPHWVIRSSEWILDPTSGQWGEDPLLVFREGSQDDWYDPGTEVPFELSDDELVDRFARELSGDLMHELLRLAGLTHLEGAIEAAREELIAGYERAHDSSESRPG